VGVGVYTQVNTSQSAAVGYGSVTSSGRNNVVSVGSGGVAAQDSNGNSIPFPAPKTRIIENVTNGQYSQDAATVGQLPGQFVTSSGAASSGPTTYYRFGNDATSSGQMTTSSPSVTLQNVAPGAVSSTSTDAVNGSQLYATNQNVTAAQNTANQAQTAATGAQTTANQALQVGQSAQSAAAAAQNTANSAQSAANAAQGTANQSLQIGQQNTAQIQAVNTAVSAVNQLLKANICHIVGSSITCGQQAQVMGGNTLTDPNNPNNSKAAAAGATAIGYQAKANDVNTTAIGNGASASYAGSVAIGAGAQANADPTTAVGNNAIANGDNSVALGANTTANGNNSVALGQGSVANRANSVSVGNAATGFTRQITNVAPGTAPTDAVNLAQLQNGIGKAQQYAASVGSVVASLAEAAAQAAAGRHANTIGASIATYNGQGSLAISYQHRFNNDWAAGVSVSSNGSNTTAAVGGNYSW
jgi:autotransporter adhesin